MIREKYSNKAIILKGWRTGFAKGFRPEELVSRAV